jgi:hypothetical protein
VKVNKYFILQEIEKMNNEESYQLSSYAEHWYQRAWRPSMAAIYMMLCILDYGVRPIVNYYQTKIYSLSQIVETIQELEPTVQIQILNQSRQEAVPPILSEFVHLAFGAILGVAAFSRGMEKPTMPQAPVPVMVQNMPATPPKRRAKDEIDNPDEEPADG